MIARNNRNDSWIKLHQAAELLEQAARDLKDVTPEEAKAAYNIITDLNKSLGKLYALGDDYRQQKVLIR